LLNYCTFCEIVAGKEPAEVLYEDDEVIVFRNRLRWVPVMLLAIPKKHMSQAELWRDMGSVGEIAVRMGQEHCPRGFRLLSNLATRRCRARSTATCTSSAGRSWASTLREQATGK